MTPSLWRRAGVRLSAAAALLSVLLGGLSYWLPTGVGWYRWLDRDTQRAPVAAVDFWRGTFRLEFGHPGRDSWRGKGYAWPTGRIARLRSPFRLDIGAHTVLVLEKQTLPVMDYYSSEPFAMQAWWLYRVWCPFWVAALVFSIWPAIHLWRGPIRRRLRLRSGLCVNCAYDLRGQVEPRCPECATPIPTAAAGREDGARFQEF